LSSVKALIAPNALPCAFIVSWRLVMTAIASCAQVVPTPTQVMPRAAASASTIVLDFMSPSRP
jgi:ABC-type nitrate/sulfonate/bicarbonate transport system permease component